MKNDLAHPARRRCCLPTLLLLCGTALLAGCRRESSPANEAAAETKIDRPVRVLVIDDEPLGQEIERQWRAKAETEIRLTQASADEVQHASRLSADIVIYPSALIGPLAERGLIAKLPEEASASDEYHRREILNLQRSLETAWGVDEFAVPFGSPQLMIIYRRDIWEKLQLEPPTTWAEYLRLAQQLSDRESLGSLAPEADQPWRGAVEPLAGRWAALMVLARGASYARHKDNYSTLFSISTMEPLIDGPPFARALEELVAANENSESQDTENLVSPGRAFAKVLENECAMAIGWPNGYQASSAAAGQPKPIAFAELPRADRVYNVGESKWESNYTGELQPVPLLAIEGRLGSITSESSMWNAAANMLVLLSGKEWSPQISPASRHVAPYRRSHLTQSRRWLPEIDDDGMADRFAELAAVAFERHEAVFALRIPGREEYLAALELATRDVLQGKTSVAESLGQVANQWRQITETLGVEQQRTAYRHSLGLD